MSKLAAHWQVVNFRQAHGLFACCGILFNHESPRRGESFVSRRISLGLARVHAGQQECLTLGNLEARRDWGHAADYVRAQWLMLQQSQPDDYVIATGEQHSVRDFVEAAAAELGMRLAWEGEGTDELARVAGVDGGGAVRPGQVVVRVAAENLRANDVHCLQGDAAKARRLLDWTPTVRFDALVREMVASDRALVAGTRDQRG